MRSASIIDQANTLLAAGRADAAVQLVTTAAARGDRDALNQLALWHVYGTPVARNFGTARDLFGRAGAAGHKTAALTHAVFVAIGAGARPDWQTAMHLLKTAAERDPIARRQSALLSEMHLAPEGLPATIRSVEAVSPSPQIGIIRELFTPEECAHVITHASPLLVPSIVVDPATGRQIPHPIRTSDGTVLGPIQQDLVVEALNRRIAAVTDTRVEQGEPLAVMRYAPGQEYRLHHDCLPGEPNQRIRTVIVYLNDGYGGGATYFPAIDRTIRVQLGDAVVFTNVLPDGNVDQQSRHAGQPVTHGEKWICTRWIRDRDFDPWGMRRL